MNELELRQNAAKGNIEAIESLLLKAEKNNITININSKGPQSGKTAAHFAAAGNHASMLRLLHNLGADFTLKDNEGNIPFALTKSEECQTVFSLVELGLRALEATQKTFPHSVDVNYDNENSKKLSEFRNKTLECVEAAVKISASNIMKSIDITKIETNKLYEIVDFLFQLHDHYETIKLSKENNFNLGACAEMSAASFVSLANDNSHNFCVDQFTFSNLKKSDPHSNFNDHTIAILNRNSQNKLPNSLSQALIVDALSEKYKLVFFEHMHMANQSLMKRCYFDSLENIKLICSSHIPSMLPAGLNPAALKIIEDIYQKLNKAAGEALNGPSAPSQVLKT
ncbi:MAG: ankyrin repeat domain-containing protein [Legionellales bacterium]